MKTITSDLMIKTVSGVSIQILEAEYAKLDSRWRKSGVCSPYSRLYYIISGEGKLRIYQNSAATYQIISLLPGNLYLIPNGLRYDYWCEDRLEKVYFHINVFLQSGLELFYGCEEPCCQPVAEGLPVQMKQWLLSENSGEYFKLQGQLYHAVGMFMQAVSLENKVNQRFSTPVKSFFERKWEWKQNASISQIAKCLNIADSTLVKKFKKETGMTIGYYREQLIMFRARQMLAMDQLSIGQIAEQLGFSDQFYFCKYFKQRQGQPPTAYRKKYR